MTFRHARGEYEYTVERRSRARFRATMDSFGKIIVHAPYSVSNERIVRELERLSDRFMQEVDRRLSNPRYILDSGHAVPLRGKEAVLSLHFGKRAAAHEEGNVLHLYPKDDNEETVRKAYHEYLRKSAQSEFARSLERMMPVYMQAAGAANVQMPVLKVRRLTATWGICRPKKGIITLNFHLMQVDSKYLDAVMAHELCHLTYAAHSKQFYALLEKCVPDCRAVQRELDRLAYVINI